MTSPLNGNQEKKIKDFQKVYLAHKNHSYNIKYLFYFKGWCGWKGADFWNQQVHYNMCMPQRPDMI